MLVVAGIPIKPALFTATTLSVYAAIVALLPFAAPADDTSLIMLPV